MDIQWPLVLFTFLTSIGGCLFVFTGINEFTKKSSVDGFMPGLVAIILAIVGGICSVFHLEHVERMMNALNHPTSGIFVEAVLIGCLAVCVAVYLLCLRRNAQAGVKVFAVLGIVFGITLSFMAGHSYIMAAIATWNTMLLPTGYLFTALPMGATLYWALACREEAAARFMAICTIVCGILGFIGALAYSIASGAFLSSSAVIAILSVILSGIVPAAIGCLSLKKMDAEKAKAAKDEKPAEAEKAAEATEADKTDTAAKAAEAADATAEKDTADSVQSADGKAKITVDESNVNIWIAFASSTLGALLYRVLMWTMYVAAYGFFGRNF